MYNYDLQSKLHDIKSVINFSFLPLLAEATKKHYVCILYREKLENNIYESFIKEINENNFDAVIIVTDHCHVGTLNYPLCHFSAPCFILSPVDENCSTITFPYWLIAYPKYYNINTETSCNFFEKQYIFSCLSYRYRAIRAANLIKLHKSTFWKQSLISFNNIPQGDTASDCINDYIENGQSYFEENLKCQLPLAPIKNNIENLLDYTNPAYLNSYVNIVLEHTINYAMFTEKTIKCLLAEQIFVIFGGVGIISLLEKYGFDVYRDIIDHSKYENTVDPSIRLKNLYVLLEEIKHYNWEHIYQKTSLRRERNKKLLLGNDLKIYFDQIIFNSLPNINS